MITVIGDMMLDILVRQDTVYYATDSEGDVDLRAGGQGGNVAAWIAACGGQSHLIGKVGDDPFGAYLIGEAEKRGVKCSVTPHPGEKTGRILVMVDRNGERSMIVDRGANRLLSEADIQGIEDSRLLYISGYTFYVKETRDAAQYAKREAGRRGIPVAVDPSSLYHLRFEKTGFISFLEGTTFLFPNYEEGKALTGEEEPARIVESLRRWVPHPVLKLGEKGCMLFADGIIVHVPAPSAEPVDSTGAGDAFAGAFMAEYQRTSSVLKAAQYAVGVAARVVQRVGGQPEIK